MQRSALSVTSNIAEGYGRQTKKDKINFYVMARGSLTELQNQTLAARDTGRITKERLKELAEMSTNARKLLQGLIRSIESKT